MEETVFHDIEFSTSDILLMKDVHTLREFLDAIRYDADWEYFERFQEPIHEVVHNLESWCLRCCKGEWAILNFPVEQWGRPIVFTFKNKADAAMFKLAWGK